MSDHAALVADAKDPGRALSAQEWAHLALRLADALEAVQQTPAVDREALGDIIRPHIADEYMQGQTYPSDEVVLDEIFASGILLDAAEVEARGLEKAADEEFSALSFNQDLRGGPGHYLQEHHRASVKRVLLARAQQVREGKL